VTPDGVLTAELARGALRGTSPRLPRSGAIAVENTHNAAGGKVMRPEVMAAIAALARESGLRLHLDGARLWNAAAALTTAPATLTRGATTVMVSLSKGLGCPVGSCLAFARELRPRAWEMRKRLGGGMRQSGILAAAGLYALEHNLPRIAEDHANARRLADLLADSPTVRPSAPETNIVMLDLLREADTADRVIPRLAERGVLVVPFAARRLRAVTHLDVSRADVERAAGVIREVLR